MATWQIMLLFQIASTLISLGFVAVFMLKKEETKVRDANLVAPSTQDDLSKMILA